jgi:hypothetical protein
VFELTLNLLNTFRKMQDKLQDQSYYIHKEYTIRLDRIFFFQRQLNVRNKW